MRLSERGEWLAMVSGGGLREGVLREGEKLGENVSDEVFVRG